MSNYSRHVAYWEREQKKVKSMGEVKRIREAHAHRVLSEEEEALRDRPQPLPANAPARRPVPLIPDPRHAPMDAKDEKRLILSYRESYARGDIELEEFESKVESILLGERPADEPTGTMLMVDDLVSKQYKYKRWPRELDGNARRMRQLHQQYDDKMAARAALDAIEAREATQAIQSTARDLAEQRRRQYDARVQDDLTRTMRMMGLA